MNAFDETQRRASFEGAARALGAADEGAIDITYAALLDAYAESHRAYHSQAHIDHCLMLVRACARELVAPSEVTLAIWFHDAIYATDPSAKNEAESAALAEASCDRMGIGPAARRRIAEMILATKTHVFPDGVSADDVDFGTMLDIDLSILGEDEATYAAFERDVRAEYGWVPEPLFRAGRTKVLQMFLERDPIYKTARMRARYEARARVNLARAIAALTSE